MNDAERAAAQAILAEKVKDCEGRRMEDVRSRDERIAELEKENESLKKQVRWLAERFSGECNGVPTSKYFLQLAEQASKEAGE